jgi:hypothetical protein
MTKSELIELALKNARSHYPEAVMSEELREQLQGYSYLSFVCPAFGKRLMQCTEIEYLTDRILYSNNYTSRQRTFCNRGLNCDCDIPCGV